MSEKHQELVDDREHSCQVNAGKYDRNKKDRKHLRVNAFPDVIFRHTNLLHDPKS